MASIKEINQETKQGIRGISAEVNFSQPKIIACQTSKEKLIAKLDDGREVSILLSLINKWIFGREDIKSEQLKNYEIWNEGDNIYFPDIDDILPARVLSRGLFSSCNEDIDVNEKEKKAVEENFIWMFTAIRAEKWVNFIDKTFPKVLCQEKEHDQQKILYIKDFKKDKEKIIKWLKTKRKLLEEEVVLIFDEKVVSKKDVEHITNRLIPSSCLENNFLAVLINRKDAGLSIQAKDLRFDNKDDGIIVIVNYENAYACILKN